MLTVLQGDCRGVLKTLPDESVHCCVTSPPYFGLRDYGTAQWEGGSAGCVHTRVARRCDKVGRNDKQSTQKGSSSDKVSLNCLLCGATRTDSQIGLDPTPEEYVSQLVAVFREVRRVLRKDGTLWLNLGDSYSAHAGQRKTTDVAGIKQQSNVASVNAPSRCVPALGAKQLCGIPWRVAFALQADGWYLRSDIIWSKNNPMPESVRDRPTRSHEYLFLLAKSQSYYYDADAIREPYSEASLSRYDTPLQNTGQIIGARQPGREWKPENVKMEPNPLGRNRRSVWTINSQPFSGAHFATFPEDLVRPCILAGCPVNGEVLDPFAGSGTVGRAALSTGRRATLIELNPEYCKLIEKRCETTYGLRFGDVSQ